MDVQGGSPAEASWEKPSSFEAAAAGSELFEPDTSDATTRSTRPVNTELNRS